MPKNYLRAGSVALALLWLLSACGSDMSPNRSLSVVATEMQFTPQTLRAVQGEFVTLDMPNKGQLAHNLVLELATGARTIAAEHGSTASTTFPVPVAGSYRFYCSIPGHEAMVGELIVEAKK